MSIPRNEDRRRATRRLRRALLAAALLASVAPAVAWAVPVTYEFSSGSAVIRGTLEGEAGSIFLGSPTLATPLVDITAVVDHDAGAFGRIESLNLVGGDFSVVLDSARLGIDTLNVFTPTITSLSGSDLNAFGQFALQTVVTADVTGMLPGGIPFGPESIQSAADTGSASGLVFVSGDQVMIQVIGVTVASIDPAEFGLNDPLARNVELKMDFTFVGTAATPIPEPAAAVVFAVGLAVVCHRLNRFPSVEDAEEPV